MTISLISLIEKGIVHRDICGDNYVVGEDEENGRLQLLLIDFGFSRKVGEWDVCTFNLKLAAIG